MYLLWVVCVKFLICTSTEAQSQPQFQGDNVLYAEFCCLSFEPSFIRFGWIFYSDSRPIVNVVAVNII